MTQANDKKSGTGKKPEGKAETKAQTKTAHETAAKPSGNTTNDATAPGSNSQALVADQLRAIVAEVKRLNAEKREIEADLKETLKGAKTIGFDTKAIQLFIRREGMTPEQIKAEEELERQADLYAEVVEPELSEAMRKGIQAASEGLPVSANPYTKKSPNHDKWLGAWQMQHVTMASAEKDSPEEQEQQTTEPNEEAQTAA